ncbi:MAG: bifunctional alpha,alpha-trehalose-phosphate synthase (UDP-forming)/trehalose-phosphatase [Deltaproteobacteria bacterium]|nr:bifunctional alpha,alpha-trehalose-phosphate synthase (UDP-forming)/trehalose-phosphatase [Deltaproteobacteria bacterium]
MTSIVNVSNRLPVTIDETIKRSSGGLAAAMESLDSGLNLKWVGWAGGNVQSAARREALAKEIRERFNYRPIFLDPGDVTDYYDGYSNSSLWPLLHYMTTYACFDHRWYDAYRKVNRIFAQSVLEVVDPGDLVWVHDYHLMLLPAILKERRPDVKVGFFLHTPFPSSEIFRCHPNREALLRGVLGADLIGFQTFGYLRHFRSTVLRILGLESEISAIVHDQNVTSLGVYPIGINSRKFEQELRSDTYIKHLIEYGQAHHGRKIILSVERLDYTKGIPRRLDAIEQFLSTYPHKEDVVFIFISVPSREEVAAYQVLIEEVQGRVSQINGKHSSIKNVPVHFIHQSVNFSQLCALYTLADVCMVTPLIDGMNLVAKEYIACQRENSGVLILSEFAGAAQELPNALIVNPYDTQQMVAGLLTALDMPIEDRRQRLASMQARVMSYDALRWANTFINDLAGQKPIDTSIGDTPRITLASAGKLTEASNIALFLDYDGTLAEIRKNPADAYPSQEIRELFSILADTPGLDVCIISGRKRADMLDWFGAYDFFLVAEHGFFYRYPGKPDWIVFDAKADLAWIDRISAVFRYYADMTPGSSVEVKTSSLVWHYRESDPEFGSWKAHQLVGELYDMLANLPVEVHHGKKIVEVGSIRINKGMVMEHLFSAKNYDVGLCAGDDETDESMFRKQETSLISIKVGEGATAAQFRCPSPKAFRQFLSELAGSRKTKS